MNIHTHTRNLFLAAGLLLSPGLAQGQTLINGLINYWNFDDQVEDVAPDVAGSASTSDNDGTLNGTVTFVDGQAPGFGKAGNFPGGAGNNVTIPDPDTGTNDIDRSGADLTISIWAKLVNRDNNWQAIIAHGEGQDYRLALRGGNNPVQVAYAGGGASSDIFTASTIGDGPAGDDTWHHIVAITEGSSTKLYLDGVLEVSGGTGPINENGQNLLCIGCNPTNGREWNGLIDDVAMWNRALTDAEVLNIYNTGASGSDLSSLLVTGDDDGDGLPNAWEIQFGLDPNDDGSTDPNNGANGDPDADNVTNLDELNNSTKPNDDDTDDDGLKDGVETNNGENSWVSATDTGTDPLNPDSDGDGLLDGVEDNGGTNVSPTQTGSNPTIADTDADTMPDGYEIDHGLDPNVDDTTLDPDEDTIDNITEFGLGTHPNKKDTDDDFSDDNVEITNTTDPLDPDSDGDGLLDGHETNNGPDSFVSATDTGTDPLVTDSDADGTHDGAEVAGERDPTVANGLTGGLGQKLVAYWNFDNNLDDVAHTLPGESMVADAGAFTGPDTDVFYSAEGKFGDSALEQNGGAGWVTVPASVDTLRGIDNAVSVSAWVKVPAFSSNWQSVIAHGEGAQWRLARRAAETTVAWAGGSGDIPGATTGPDIEDDEWHHIVATSDATQGMTAIYIDGVEIATGASPTISDTSDGGLTVDLFIGANPNRTNREWNGKIDDLAVWGRALTTDEIAEIYNEGFGNSIGDLLGNAAGLAITDITFDPSAGDNGQFSLTWNSRTNAPYSIYLSQDLINWDFEVADGVVGQDGSTTFTFDHPNPGSTELFFRVEPPRP
ncbi:MAG: LamG-like jellyroll fold domain-containing protein [Verrucomicrobiaceae bacterium]